MRTEKRIHQTFVPTMTAGMGWLLCTAFLISCNYAAGALCGNGEYQHVEGTRCRHYTVCENGVWILKQCSIGQTFDPATSECKSVSEVKCVDTAPSCEEGKVYPHAGSKSLYHLCLYGRISTRYCSAGEVFDPFTQSCEVDTASLTLRVSSGRSKRNANDACTEGTKHRDGTSCRNYKECINGEEVVKRCPDCTNYDEVTKKCRFNIAVPCGPNTYTEKPSTQGTTTPTPTASTPTTSTPPTPTASTPPTPTASTPPTPPTPTDSTASTPPTPTASTPPTPPTPTDTTASTPPTPTAATSTASPVTLPGSTAHTETSSQIVTKPNTGETTPAEPTSDIVTKPNTEYTTPTEPTSDIVTKPNTEYTTPIEPTSDIVTKPNTEYTTPTEPTSEPVTPPEPTTDVTDTTTLSCVEGEKIPVKDEKCKAYEQCVKGILVNKTCSWGFQFDTLKKDCISSFWRKIHCDK